jgi:hypothetical protein
LRAQGVTVYQLPPQETFAGAKVVALVAVIFFAASICWHVFWLRKYKNA